MKPVRLPGDPAVAIKDYLATAVAPVAVAQSLPAEYTKSQTRVVVFDDGGPAFWPVSTSPTIRVTVWADGRTASRTVARQCWAHVTSMMLPGITVSNVSAILDARDPHNQAHMASFTVTARCRTTAA